MSFPRSGCKESLSSFLGVLSLFLPSFLLLSLLAHSLWWTLAPQVAMLWRHSGSLWGRPHVKEARPASNHMSELGRGSYISWALRWLQPSPRAWLTILVSQGLNYMSPWFFFLRFSSSIGSVVPQRALVSRKLFLLLDRSLMWSWVGHVCVLKAAVFWLKALKDSLLSGSDVSLC